MILRHWLGLAVLSAALSGVTACDRSAETTGSNTGTPTNTAREPDRTGTVTNETANNTAAANASAANNGAVAGNTAAGGDNVGAGNSATTQPGASSDSRMPGLPTVNGTSVKGLSTPDAAATRLIDEAKNSIAKGDLSKAKTLVSEMQQKGMYDSLSAPVKSQVDELALQIEKGGTTTQPQ